MSITVKDLTYIYEQGTTYEKRALSHINLEIGAGEFIGLIGHTGSGKSTLIQTLNGLIRPTEGSVYYNDEDIFSEKGEMRKLRQKIGLVFQYPEYQLFETTVGKDIAFGPKNMGLGEEEIKDRVKRAMEIVGLAPEISDKSPFDLSGGQRRRVAIAGILAMEPEYLILDEPTAGLDPRGREEILDEVASLHKQRGITVILVSHSMDDVAEYVERIIAMDKGTIRYDGSPGEVFSHEAELKTMGLDVPQATQLSNRLRERGWEIPGTILNLNQMEQSIIGARLRKEEDR